MAAPQIFHFDERFRIAFWNNVSIVDVWGDLDASRMQQLGTSYRELLGRYPSGILAIALIQSSTPVSSAEARAEVARVMKELGERMLHTAMVIEADGVIGLMLRSVVRGLNLFLRNNRMSLHDSCDQAIPLIAPQVDTRGLTAPGSVARELAAAVAWVRSHHVPAQTPRASGMR